MNTINETSAATYKVEICSADGKVGDTVPTSDHAAVKEQYANLRAVYPQSKLLMSLDGAWFEATDEEMARSAAIAAALALAGLYQRQAPRITWVLQDYQPGVLGGQADTREQVQEYADLLGAEVVERVGEKTTSYTATGTFDGVSVRVSCMVTAEQPAEVSS